MESSISHNHKLILVIILILLFISVTQADTLILRTFWTRGLRLITRTEKLKPSSFSIRSNCLGGACNDEQNWTQFDKMANDKSLDGC